MAEIAFHPEASAEFQEAFVWYHGRSARAATGFEAEMERVLGLIQATPELFSPYDVDHRFAVLKRYSYSIVYQIQPDRVWIVAIAHFGRAPGYWKDRI